MPLDRLVRTGIAQIACTSYRTPQEIVFGCKEAMKPRLFIVENANALDLEPLTWTRPVFSLVSGAGTILNRLKRLFRADLSGLWVRSYIENICLGEYPGLSVNSFEDFEDERPWLMVDASWVPPEGFILPSLIPHQGVHNGKVVYLCLGPEEKAMFSEAQSLEAILAFWDELQMPQVDVQGWQFQYLWDLIDKNSDLVCKDFDPVLPASGLIPSNVALVGNEKWFVRGSGVELEPFTMLDTRNGPIVLETGVKVQSFSRIEGPCWLGANTIVYGARIKAGTSIGPCSRVGGEIENSIIQGYANKYHDGFLGHSYLGEWVNLGAGTISSDLRNDYSTIRVMVQNELIDARKIKVGAFLGDHCRTGIGTLLNAGTKAGVFTQLLPGDGYLSRNIPSFTTASGSDIFPRMDLKNILEVAGKVFARRNRKLPSDLAKLYGTLYTLTSRERGKMTLNSGFSLNRLSA
ncbi:MAG: hypothetical protein RL595_3086 [Planctomycetota bacterium]